MFIDDPRFEPVLAKLAELDAPIYVHPGLSRTISRTYRDQVWVGPSGMLDTPRFMFAREVLGLDRVGSPSTIRS